MLKKRYGFLLFALILPMTFAGAHPGQRPRGETQEESVTRKKIAEDFAEMIIVAKENYAGQVDFEKVTKASIGGMLRTLDPHSMYFDRKGWEEFQNDQRSRYFGIGSTIGQRNGKVYIISPTEGTPSFRAGVRYGDQIIEVNGESTIGLTQAQVRSKLLGPEGTPITIKVNRAGEPKPLEFSLKRGAVPLPSVSNFFMLAKGVGYVNLDRGFNTTTYEEVRSAIADLQRQGMGALILDLRGNHGGLVEQAWRVSNQFLYRGQKVLSMKGRAASFPTREYVANNNSPDDYPVVVLIDRSSASASEIVAGALQDHDRARIVGENSFGKGLVQSPFGLGDGSALVLTTGHYYTPSGRLIQRDYSGRSFYDYYLKRGDKEEPQKTEEKLTDSGRKVYGGGGIDPDVVVKERITQRELELQRAWFEPVFDFSRALVGGQIPGFAEFRINAQADHRHRLGEGEFQINDKILAAFKAYLREHKELKADESRIDRDAEYIKRQIRYEVVTAAYGIETAYQVLLNTDAQVQAAINEIPKAKEMAEDIRRLRASSREGDPRKNE
jgi:carboxyl-terminal processing protease